VWRVPLGEYKDLTARGVRRRNAECRRSDYYGRRRVVYRRHSDLMFRAFDPKTGKELWSTQLENSAVNTPLTYQAGGKQYVSVGRAVDWVTSRLRLPGRRRI